MALLIFISTLSEVLSLGLVIVIARVGVLRSVVSVPLVFVVFATAFCIVVVYGCHVLRSLAHPAVVHMLLLRVLQRLIGLLQQFELLNSSWVVVVVGVVLASWVRKTYLYLYNSCGVV